MSEFRNRFFRAGIPFLKSIFFQGVVFSLNLSSLQAQDETVPPVTPAATQNFPKATPATTPSGVTAKATPQTPSEPAPAPTSPNKQEGYVINFNNVNIIEYIRFISKISGKNFVFDEIDLNFRVSIISDEPTSIHNIMMALLQVLRIHGLSMLEQGNNILIHKNASIPIAPNVIPHEKGQEWVGEHEIITQIFSLKNTVPENVVLVVKTMASLQARVEAVPETKHLVVTDFSSNVKKIAELIRGLDTPSASLSIGRYYVSSNIPMPSLINIAEKVLTPLAGEKGIQLIPHPASGSVFVVSTPYLVDRALAVLYILEHKEGGTRVFSLEQLDYTSLEEEAIKEAEKEARRREEEAKQGKVHPGKEGLEVGAPEAGRLTGGRGPLSAEAQRQLYLEELPAGHIAQTSFGVMKLQYRKGDSVQKALQSLASRLLQTGQVNPEIVSAIDSIQWISDSNIIVFTGTREATKRVRELVNELDTPVRQVFLEMLVIETDVDNSLTFGVQSGLRVNNFSLAVGEGLSELGSPLPAALNAGQLGVAPIIGPVVSQAGFNVGIIGNIITHGGQSFTQLGALVQALNTDTQTDILVNPRIVVEDNTPAEIFVGQNIPFKGQSVANDQGTIITTNFEFRDIGTRLKITPYLNRGDLITLELAEERSSAVVETDPTLLATEVAAGPITNKENTTTRVHVPNGYFIILSGLINESYTKRIRRVPCLGGLPVVGALFGSHDRVVTKRNVMIFIRPQIISTPEEIDMVTKRQQDIWRDKHARPEAFNFELETGLEWLNLKRDHND